MALIEAKEIVEGEEFDNIIGVDDGKTIMKVIITKVGLSNIETYLGYLEQHRERRTK